MKTGQPCTEQWKENKIVYCYSLIEYSQGFALRKNPQKGKNMSL